MVNGSAHSTRFNVAVVGRCKVLSESGTKTQAHSEAALSNGLANLQPTDHLVPSFHDLVIRLRVVNDLFMKKWPIHSTKAWLTPMTRRDVATWANDEEASRTILRPAREP